MDPRSPLLAVRLPNWVGDVVMALPSLLQLQRAGFVVCALGKNWAKDLLAGVNVPVTAVPRGIVAASRVHRTLRMDCGLLFTNSLSTAMSMRLAGIPAVGYKTDCRSPLLYAGLIKNPGLHEVEYFWRLGAAAAQCWAEAGATWPARPPERLDLPLSTNHRAAAIRALIATHVSGPYVVCCPMSADETRGRSKRWPHFGEFCRELIRAGRTVVVCPGPCEEGVCAALVPKNVTMLRGLSLGVYAAVMEQATAVVANDSGPMHMAAAVGAPLLGVFGHGDPTRTRPWNGHFIGGDGWPDLDTGLAAFDELLRSMERPATAGRIGAAAVLRAA